MRQLGKTVFFNLTYRPAFGVRVRFPLTQKPRESIIWQKRVEQLLEYFLCQNCEKEMHQAYANGEELSYVPGRCNSANIHHLMCRTPSNILRDRLPGK